MSGICTRIINPMITAGLVSILAGSLTACGDEETDRFERVAKLRAIGVSTNPVVLAAPASGTTESVELTAFAALPKGGVVGASSFLDEASAYSSPLPVSVDSSTATTEGFAALDLYSVKATATVGPLTPQQEAILLATGKLIFRYGIKLDSGDESETIVGNILVYPAGSPEVSFQALSANVAEPLANATIGTGPDQVLSGTATKPQEEAIKFGWFVSSGKVKNRRARETKWEPVDSGSQTVIMTARGMKSGSFALKAVDVTVQ